MNLKDVYLDFHCNHCGEVLTKFQKGRFNNTAFCQNPECKKLVSFSDWLLIVSFIEPNFEEKDLMDGIQLECPHCKTLMENNEGSKAKDVVFCKNCFKESKVIETIQFYRKF